MSMDFSQLLQVGAQLNTASGTVGARGAAVVRKTAKGIESDAKAIIIRDDIIDSGDMLNSVGVDIQGDGRFGGITAEIGPTVEYAPFVEDGTTKMEAQPFMAPAFARRLPGFEAAVEQLGGEIL